MKRLLPFAAAAVFLAACNPGGSDLVGTWTCNASDGQMSVTGTVTYSSANTVSTLATMTVNQEGQRIEANVAMQGSYKMLGDGRSEETVSSVNVASATVNGQPVDPRMVEQMFKGLVGQTAIQNVAIDGNKMTVSSTGAPTMTCTR